MRIRTDGNCILRFCRCGEVRNSRRRLCSTKPRISWRTGGRGDAEKLATLEMEADVAWPGGGGWQTTPEEQEREIRESNLMGAFVTENKQRIISICTIRTEAGAEGAGVYSLPQLPPGLPWEEARQVRTLGSGGQRLRGRIPEGRSGPPGPGNLKAVPLYKKMGFMWRPDSSVHMENFTPAARRHPLATAFFARHDWYETHVRDLSLEEDAMIRGAR